MAVLDPITRRPRLAADEPVPGEGGASDANAATPGVSTPSAWNPSRPLDTSGGLTTQPAATPTGATGGSFTPGSPTSVSPGAAGTLQGMGVPVTATPDPTQNPTLLADPAYQAFMRNLGLEQTTLKTNAQAASEGIDRDLALSRATMAEQNTQALGGINNSMESRGIFHTGENVSNQNQQWARFGAADSAAVADAANRKAALQQTLSERLADLQRQAADHALTASQALQLQDAASKLAAGQTTAGTPASQTFGGAGASPMVKSAMSWVGEPYQWGGGHGKVGAPKSQAVDCSGLVQQVFGENGITITGTAADMQRKGTAVPSLAQARPGDLVFWGQPAHHVGIYIGNGQMIDAPHTGANVRIEPVQGFGKDFAGIRRIV